MLLKASLVVNEFALEFKNHDLALSFNENWSSHKQMASFETLFILMVSHLSMKGLM